MLHKKKNTNRNIQRFPGVDRLILYIAKRCKKVGCSDRESELIEGTEKCTHAIPHISNLQLLQTFQLCLSLPKENFLVIWYCTVVAFIPKELYPL